MRLSDDKMKALKADWVRIAQEEVQVEQTPSGFTLFAFGSEIACLRLSYAYRRKPEDLPFSEVKFHRERDAWGFTLDNSK